MIFGQINYQINLILNEKSTFFIKRKLILNKTKQRKLINLIHEHSLKATEIHKFNLIIRRTIGCFFISYSIGIIMALYLLVNSNEFIIKLLLIEGNLVALIFGFSICYLLTLLIKSAHQPLNTVRSIVCKYKTNLRLKLKVS